MAISARDPSGRAASPTSADLPARVIPRGAYALIVAGLALATAACEGRRTITGESALGRLTVRVRPAPTIAGAAQALGWPADAVPDAVVVVTRTSAGSSVAGIVDTVITDATGLARFPNLDAVQYSITVTRTLTPAEEAAAGDAIGNALSFAGAGTANLGASGSDSIDVEMRAVGGSSIIFSEIYPTNPLDGRGGLYYYDNYWEIYNNADTAVALAGKLWFDAYPGYINGPVYGCKDFASLGNDPAGLWANYVYRFPDDAAPLQPGKSVVVATDAIDHRQIRDVTGFFDLSHAQFEFPGTADADNPLAKNMVDIGPHPSVGDGHGYRTWASNRFVWGLANPVDLRTLPTQSIPAWGAGAIQVRLPKSALLDVVQYHERNGYQAAYPDCPSAVNRDFDAGMVELLTLTDTLSIHRRVAKTLPSGRVILQVSHNSAADFVAGPGTPGRVP